MLCWPSSRLIDVNSGVNDPALMFVVSDASEGANGSGLLHELPFGPVVMSNSEVDWSTS